MGTLKARVGGVWVPILAGLSAGGRALNWVTPPADTTLITTEALIPGYTMTITLAETRQIEVEAIVTLAKPLTASIVRTYLRVDGTEVAGSLMTVTQDEFATHHVIGTILLGAGTHTVVYNAQADAGNCRIGGGKPGYMVARDVSGSGNAAASVDSVPRGLIASHTLQTAFSTTGTHTVLQDEGLTVTINEIAGRKYEFVMSLNPYAPGGVGGGVNVQYRILRNGVSQHVYDLPNQALSGNTGHAVTYTHIVPSAVGGAGVVWKIQLAATGANIQVSSYGDASYPRSLYVKDLG